MIPVGLDAGAGAVTPGAIGNSVPSLPSVETNALESKFSDLLRNARPRPLDRDSGAANFIAQTLRAHDDGLQTMARNASWLGVNAMKMSPQQLQAATIGTMTHGAMVMATSTATMGAVSGIKSACQSLLKNQ